MEESRITRFVETVVAQGTRKNPQKTGYFHSRIVAVTLNRVVPRRNIIAIQMKQSMKKQPLAAARLMLALATLLICSPTTHAQNADTNTNVAEPASLLDKMLGKWVMTGTIAGQDVTHDVTVDRILNRQYIRIHEISRELDADGEPAYEAWIHIAWDKEKAEYAVMWLDNTATTNFAEEGVGHGKPDGDKIPFVWKSSDGSGIHNTFAYNGKNDTWTWAIDNVDESQKRSQFARLTLNSK